MRQWLTDVRKEKKISQEEIAQKVGVTRQMISAIENGTTPSVKTAQKIASVLDFDWTLFFRQGGKMSS